MTHVSITELRAHLRDHVDAVCESRDVLVVTRQNAASVIMMAQDEFNSIMETVHLLRSPANAANLMQSIKDLDEGRGAEFDPTQ